MRLANPFPSYAQYNEDIILLALLHDVKDGFYVDIGANDPVLDSVTKLFYDHGWRGINVEPISSLFRQLEKSRPLDTNLNIGIGNAEKELIFFENESISGHSSFNKKNAGHIKDSSILEYKVKVKPLKKVLKEHKTEHIHFLKIDVEGFEDSVIQSNDWTLYRPEVVCVESSTSKTKWQSILLKKRYKPFIMDGLNEYYVSKESWSRTEGFADRVVKLSHQSFKHHQYQDRSRMIRQLKKVTKLNQTHFDITQQQLETIEALRTKINNDKLSARDYRK